MSLTPGTPNPNPAEVPSDMSLTPSTPNPNPAEVQSDMSLTPSTPNPEPAQTVTSLAAQSSNLFQNAAGFNIIGGQFVSGDVHDHRTVPTSRSTDLSMPSFNVMDDSFSESEIYCNQLMRRRRGFPLYVPGPPENLPAEYRRHGVAIGDVGSITPEGIFDFYFNIYLPADHPINDNDVPENFYPLIPYASKSLTSLVYDPGDSVSTSSIQKFISPDEFPGGDFIFSCAAPQGAVLALPYGAHLKKLNYLEPVREYVAAQAESWYEHINGVRGRGLANGSLYLVTGCEKAPSWGMASFYGTSDPFQVAFTQSARASSDSAVRYRWHGMHDHPGPSQHKRYDPSPIINDAPLNQTTFIHGLSISLGVGIWGKLFGKVGINDIMESQLGSSSGRVSLAPASSLFSSVLGFLGGRGSTGGSSPAGRGHRPNDDNVNVPENAFLLFHRSILASAPPPLSANARGKEREADHKTTAQQWKALSPEEKAHWEALADADRPNVVLSDLPPIVKIFHPAEIINNYILEKVFAENMQVFKPCRLSFRPPGSQCNGRDVAR
ncbi:hypothetical protein C8F04DRAFT_1156523 [Mycena alexandri]|uniref:HMG box domain-containing protein n=1 Tax=Mycena alexandri TaxID=1745969 RepID=A0AAD6RY12_9AGAR|nr:hypothetical protein C8F04DRAFT_1156523 [Mycena alexandri]